MSFESTSCESIPLRVASQQFASLSHYEMGTNKLRVYPIASCELINQQVIELQFVMLRANLIRFELVL